MANDAQAIATNLHTKVGLDMLSSLLCVCIVFIDSPHLQGSRNASLFSFNTGLTRYQMNGWEPT